MNRLRILLPISLLAIALIAVAFTNPRSPQEGLSPSLHVPVGTILPWWGEYKEIPEGFEECDGRNPETRDAVFKYKKPDLRGRFLRGHENFKNFKPKAQNGGGSEDGAHTHAMQHNHGAHTHNLNTPDKDKDYKDPAGTTHEHDHDHAHDLADHQHEFDAKTKWIRVDPFPPAKDPKGNDVWILVHNEASPEPSPNSPATTTKTIDPTTTIDPPSTGVASPQDTDDGTVTIKGSDSTLGGDPPTGQSTESNTGDVNDGELLPAYLDVIFIIRVK